MRTLEGLTVVSIEQAVRLRDLAGLVGHGQLSGCGSGLFERFRTRLECPAGRGADER